MGYKQISPIEITGIAWWRQWVLYACLSATPGIGFNSCFLQASAAIGGIQGGQGEATAPSMFTVFLAAFF